MLQESMRIEHDYSADEINTAIIDTIARQWSMKACYIRPRS